MALELAYNHSSKLNEIYAKSIMDERLLFWSPKAWVHYTLDVKGDDWDRTQYVSVDKKGNIKAYFKATHDRSIGLMAGISSISFDDKSIIAKKDFYTFLEKIFTNPVVRKIEWDVIVGNPIEKMYDKIVAKYGGRIIGISKEAAMLRDGKYYDRKFYEILTKRQKHI